MKLFALCLLNTAFMAAGQILFKTGSGGKEIRGLLDIIALFFSPAVFCGLCIYAAATGLWLYILSKAPISFAYPFQALAYPLVLLASALLFHEHISFQRWLGVAVIICGVCIAARG